MYNAIPILSLFFLYISSLYPSFFNFLFSSLSSFLRMHVYLFIFCFCTVKLPYLFYIPVVALLYHSLCVFCDVIIVELGLWVCGESWLVIKDCLTHRPSSQGWAPGVLLFVVHCVVSCGIVM